MADNEHKTKLTIEGDSKGAIAALKSVVGVLNSVRGAISRVMSALGLIGLAMQAVQTAVEWYKKLSDWMHRAEAAAKALREQMAHAAYAGGVAAAERAYKALNKQIAEALRLEKERNAVLDARKSRTRSVEDATLEQKRELEIAALDPNAADYGERKAQIERNYARMSSALTASRASEDVRREQARLEREAGIQDRIAADLQGQLVARGELRSASLRRVGEAREAAALNPDDVDAAERVKNAEAEYQADLKATNEMREQIKAALKAGLELREKARELGGADEAAQIRNRAAQQRITNDERREAAEKARKVAEAETEAERKEAEKRSAAEKARVNEGLRESADRANALGAFAAALTGADGVSQNRLTALGLGSGVAADGGVAGDVRKIVDLLKAEIEATKNIKPSGAATYTD